MKKRIGAAFAVTALLLGLTACATEGGGSTPASSQTTSPDSQTSSGGTQESYINTLPRNRGPAGEVGELPPMTLTENDVLTIKDGVFMLEGKPFAEISFNKFDLFTQLIDPLLKGDPSTYETMLKKQDQALAELHEMGFRSIRVFMSPWAPSDTKNAWYNVQGILFKAMDDVVGMCEKYDIKIVWCLGLTSFGEKWMVTGGWELGEYQMRELIADENSIARQEMYKYLDGIIQRYRNSKAVLTWELANEISLDADIMPDTKTYEDQRMPTLKDVATFYDQVAQRIHQNDPLRLVNSGGSSMRESQWNQYVNNSWQKDTEEEQYKALEFLYKDSACDIIDIHWYANNKLGNTVLDNETGQEMILNLGHYKRFADAIGKPLMVGEVGVCPIVDEEGYFDNYDDVETARPFFKRQLDEIVDNGIPLSYWWTYSSDRPQDEGVGGFSLKKGSDDELLGMIIEANQRLKAKYGAA